MVPYLYLGCLTVMMPSSSVLVSLFPFDVANPFEVDAFLRHTTIFSHVFHNQGRKQLVLSFTFVQSSWNIIFTM